MVQRVIAVLAVLVVLFTSFVVPISADSGDPWLTVPDYGGRDWFKDTYDRNFPNEYPDLLYDIPINGMTERSYDILNDLYSGWYDQDYINDDYYLGTGYFGLYLSNDRGDAPRGAFQAELRLNIQLYGADNTQEKPFGGSYTITAMRRDGMSMSVIYSFEYAGAYGADGPIFYRDCYFVKYQGSDIVMTRPVGDSPSVCSGSLFFAFDLEQTINRGEALANINQFLPLYTLEDPIWVVTFPNEYGIGYEVGNLEGYNKGYADGYAEGSVEWTTNTSMLTKFLVALFTAPSYIINTIFDFNLFGFNVATVVRVLLTAIIVAIITKFALKFTGV